MRRLVEGEGPVEGGPVEGGGPVALTGGEGQVAKAKGHQLICVLEAGSVGWSKFVRIAKLNMVMSQSGIETVEKVHAERPGESAIQRSRALAARSLKAQGTWRLTVAGPRTRTTGLALSKTGWEVFRTA